MEDDKSAKKSFQHGLLNEHSEVRQRKRLCGRDR